MAGERPEGDQGLVRAEVGRVCREVPGPAVSCSTLRDPPARGSPDGLPRDGRAVPPCPELRSRPARGPGPGPLGEAVAKGLH